MSRTPRRVLCGILLAAGLAGSAVASEPESGTVSSANPRVEWSMTTTGSYFVRIPVAVSEHEDAPCEAPTCETFALKLAEKANLTIGTGFEDGAGNFTVRITQGDSVTYASSTTNDHNRAKPFKVSIKNAAAGDYTIDVWNNADTEAKTFGFAEIPTTTTTGGGTTGGGTPGGQTGDPQQSGPGTSPVPSGGGSGGVQAINLRVTVGKQSARKLKKARKLKAKVTVSREVTSITAALKKGSKTIGKGKLGRTSGTKSITLKIAKKLARKLKKGSYTLNVLATDGKTSTSKTVKFKVRK